MGRLPSGDVALDAECLHLPVDDRAVDDEESTRRQAWFKFGRIERNTERLTQVWQHRAVR